MLTATEAASMSPAELARYETAAENARRETALINQKNAILSQIHAAQDGDDIERVECIVLFVSELWEAVGYGYKVREVRELLRARAQRLLDGEESYLFGLRKNDKTRRSTEGNVIKLQRVIAQLAR